MNFDFQLGNDPANDPQREGWASDCGVKYWEVGEYRGLYSQLEVFLGIVLSADQARFGATGKWSDSCFGFSNPAGANGCASLLSFMPHCLQWMDLYSPEYVYSADFQLFFDSFFSHPFGQACGRMTVGYGHQPPDEGLYFDFIEYLNSEAARRNVNKRLWDWRSSLDDQDESIRQYLARQCWGLYAVSRGN